MVGCSLWPGSCARMATWTQIWRQTTGWPPLHPPTVSTHTHSTHSAQLTLCILTSVLAPLELDFTALKTVFVFSQASAVFTEPHDDAEVRFGVKEEWAQAPKEPAKSPAAGAIQGIRIV